MERTCCYVVVYFFLPIWCRFWRPVLLSVYFAANLALDIRVQCASETQSKIPCAEIY